MAKVTTSKEGKRYLNMAPEEYEGKVALAVAKVFELKQALKAAEEGAIAAHDAEFPQLAKHPIRFQWGKVSVGLDDRREAKAAASTAGNGSLAGFLAQMEAQGRRA